MIEFVVSSLKKHSLVRAGAFFVTAVVFIPLLGLLLGIFNPIQNPLMPTVTFKSVLFQTGQMRMLWNTIALAISTSFVSVLIGTWLAFMHQRADYAGRKLLGLLSLMPLAMPSYLLAATLRETLGPGGFIGRPLGFNMFTGFVPAFVVLTVISVPYVYLLVNAALARSSLCEEEAARTLGASPWHVFRYVILPRLRPSFAFALLITQLYVISDFGAVAVLDFQVLTWRLYQAVDHQMLQEATLLGVGLLIITLPLLTFSRRLHGQVPTRMQVSNARSPSLSRPSVRALSLTYVLHALVIGLGVILPVVTLLVWVGYGYWYDNAFASLLKPLKDTFTITTLGAVVVVSMAALPAWYVARNKNRLSWLLEQMTYLSSALPGVLLAFGLMLAALFSARFLHANQLYVALLASGVLLMLGYAMRFLAEAYAPLKSAILMLDGREKESAQLLGASDWCWLKKIAWPALKPGIFTSTVLVLLAIIKELPVTLLLGGAMGIRPLSFRIFDRYREAFLHDAGLAGLVLLIFSFSMTFLLLRWRRHV